jgi:hypothetical protein
MDRAADLDLDNAGNSKLARITMMAMTTSNSIRLKARESKALLDKFDILLAT